ncbi:flagellar hook-length control protein FliK [Paenibacillus sp. HW567]|uniref:flagellar hook-length control protein FliK n=1 Tax=Paenibacillus sp. HW567 TaxID=1034769 RepID=UPI00036AF1C4|nr:flagellar hook-length control protein FliK [Paenibacillus sp. HW567]
MSLVAQSLISGKTPVTTGAATGPPAAAAGTAAVPFAQTLVQSMAGTETKGTETPLLGNLASLLQGLLNVVQATGEETGKTDTAKSTDPLQGLAENIEKLDESISSDPALLSALQGWLVQVSVLLSGNTQADAVSAEKGGGTTSPAAALSPLAQNPETLRFAVQDELNSLMGLVQQAAASGDEKAASAGITLLNNFTAILAETQTPQSKPKANTTGSTEVSTVSLKPASTAEVKNDSQVKAPVMPEARPGITIAAKTETAKPLNVVVPVTDQAAGTETNSTPTVKAAGTVEAPTTKGAADALPEVKTAEGDHEVVTAGQLSLRGGITAPLKAEAAPVPVHKFAHEMTSFITGKLDVVQKGGVAEATISLFPENLGQVDVKITMQNGHLVAQFLTQHAGAKDMLEQQMNQLRTALQSQGLQVEKLEVTQNNTPLQSQFNGQQGRGSGFGGQQQERRSKERSEENSDAVLAAELNGEWKEWVANAQQDTRSQGRSFSAKV